MKIKVSIQNISRRSGSPGFTHTEVFEVCDPENNFIQHQNEVAEAVKSMLPNITAGASYEFWRYEIIIETADD